MSELNKICCLIFGLLKIFSVHALDVILASADDDFKQNSEINIGIENGVKTYCGTSSPLTFQPKPDTSKVIVYIIDRSRFNEIVRNAVRGTRLQIAQELSEWHCELVFLGVDNFYVDDYHLVGAFIAEKIRRHPDQTNFTTETIGGNHFDNFHRFHGPNIGMYQENAQICGGTLIARLTNMPRGALRPVGSNGKEIRLYGYHPIMGEVSWPVSVVNGTYSPEGVNFSDPKYNFRIRYRSKKICLLIISGKEYSALTVYGKRTKFRMKIAGILDKMTLNNEGLLLMGVFNFDWTEIYIVTQIILEHSKGLEGFDYNVFTYGYGMFNTVYLNVYHTDGRRILSQSKSNVTDMITALMGEEVKQRAINMHFTGKDGWKISKIPINLGNGHYMPAREIENYTFPINQKLAFIVYDPAELNDSINGTKMYRSVEELKRSGIVVVVIKAINFGLDDMHIIAEWIDYHRGKNGTEKFIDSENVAVLGGGIFDTVFQSESTTYNTFFNTKRNKLERIRNAYVKSARTKCAFAAKLFDPEFEVWTYPMKTINGYYEPDLIPDKNMFGTTNGKQILFIITSGHSFHQISAISVETMEPLNSLKEEIELFYPDSDWRVFLVGLDHFEKRDYHLFAELVKRQTQDERSLNEFVWKFNYGIGTPVYQYKDNLPFPSENRLEIRSSISTFFEVTCKLPGETSSH